MSCVPVLALDAPTTVDDDVHPGTSHVLEAVATLVEAARSARWSRFAEVMMDLTGATAVHVVAGEGVYRAGFTEAAHAVGGFVEVLHPAPSVRVTLSFLGDGPRAAAAPGIHAVERILITATWGASSFAPRPSTPVASTIEALPLSPRMREVARLVVAGRSDKEIADALGVSHTSARSYVQRMCRSLAVSGRGGILRLVLGEPGPVSTPRPARGSGGQRAPVAGVSPPVASARAGR